MGGRSRNGSLLGQNLFNWGGFFAALGKPLNVSSYMGACTRVVHHELVKAMKTFMYTHPIHGGRRLHLIAILSIAVLMFTIMMVVPRLSVTNSSVASGNFKVVVGNITDGSGVVPGATVTVEMWNGAVLDGTYSTTSETDGTYQANFDNNIGPHWNIGDTILVHASKGGESGSASKIATDDSIEPVQYVNVFISPAIPEFTSFPGIALASLGLVLAVATLRRVSSTGP